MLFSHHFMMFKKEILFYCSGRCSLFFSLFPSDRSIRSLKCMNSFGSFLSQTACHFYCVALTPASKSSNDRSLLPELSVGRTAAPCSSVGEKQRKESRRRRTSSAIYYFLSSYFNLFHWVHLYLGPLRSVTFEHYSCKGGCRG